MIKISSVNREDYSSGHLVGYIENIDPEKIVNILGHPNCLLDNAYKSDWEWVITFENGEQLCIYDWKVGKNYLGKSSGCNFDEIRTWNIGGHNSSLASSLSMFLKSEKWSSFDDIRKQTFMTKECIESLNSMRKRRED